MNPEVTAEGEFDWQYHQHAAEMTASGSLILFDNGNYHALPPRSRSTVEESHSRAVEYLIDEGTRTIRQVWTYGGPGKKVFYSPFISEADQLPTLAMCSSRMAGVLAMRWGVSPNKSSSAIIGRASWR